MVHDEDNDDGNDEGGEWELRDFRAGPGLKFYCAGGPVSRPGGGGGRRPG